MNAMTTGRFVVLTLALATPGLAQEPASWGSGPDAPANTFSIIGIDPLTGEAGVTVTSKVICVGNLVPWVRPGVGAVATQCGRACLICPPGS